MQAVGVPGYLAEQFAAPVTLAPNFPTPIPAECAGFPAGCWEGLFWGITMNAPDQLRQRVAFSLSELFVVSTQSLTGLVMPAYWNTLTNDAFGNWRTLMEDVTLSPAMGNYLNMIHSNKPKPGMIANENYARELMQLFSTGMYALNQDGTQQLDAAGNPIPLYTQDQVQAFARAYTGWTYANPDGSAPTTFPNNTPNYIAPMQPVDANHDTESKTLLNGTVLAAGGSARQDLEAALDNIFRSPSLPPFVCRQLIQHLVTSAPSPAYVKRVANVFVDNGKGVRGDMQAVLTAVLMDPEARAGDTNPDFDGGHLREPILFVTSAARALSYYNANTTDPYSWVNMLAFTFGQEPFRAASVFNFYPPTYVIPGTQLNAPEFALENSATVIQRLSATDAITFGKTLNLRYDNWTTSVLGKLAGTPGDLVDALSVLMMHGQMSSAMRQQIIAALNTTTDKPTRVRLAAYLVLSSSQYKIMH